MNTLLNSLNATSVNYIAQIINYVRKAQEFAAQHGFKNLLQPGLIKELVIAEILVHLVHRAKHEPGAYDPANTSRKFECLSCFEGGTFQLGRMFKSPAAKRAKSLERLTRNAAIYCAVFDEKNPLETQWQSRLRAMSSRPHSSSIPMPRRPHLPGTQAGLRSHDCSWRC